jgi:hypothetical protein
LTQEAKSKLKDVLGKLRLLVGGDGGGGGATLKSQKKEPPSSFGQDHMFIIGATRESDRKCELMSEEGNLPSVRLLQLLVQ